MDSPTAIDYRTGSAESSVVLFDGVCHFCIASVRFILARDKKRRFRFASLDSHAASGLLKPFDLSVDDPDTIVLIEGDDCHTKSSAALRIAWRLSGPWPLFSVFLIVPKPLRDYCYDAFARRRYRWFGRRESCFVPTDDIRGRFME